MLRKCSWKVSGKSENCYISEMRTVQQKMPEIQGGKFDGTEIPEQKFAENWVYLARLFSFPIILGNGVPLRP